MKPLCHVLQLSVLGLLLASCTAPEPTTGNGFDFVVVADTAYTVPDDYPAYYALIDRINTTAPAFTLHLGDTKGGTTDCSDEALQKIKTDFNKFDHPLIYTPGDNEWTDCHTEPSGGYDPEDRLALIRQLYFKPGTVLGQQALPLQNQGTSGSGLEENVLWEKNGVLFATLHVVGSNNGLLNDSYQTPESEFAVRNQANTTWLHHVFTTAAERQSKAVVLAYHANIFFTPESPDGYADMRRLIEELGKAFAKPVLLLHGDHHRFVIDRPYGQAARNITRLQTFGAPDAKAVKIHVNPATESVFSFQPIFVGNGLYGESSF